MQNFIVLSLETHLFFARIMKEHALFLEAGFQCKDTGLIKKADRCRKEFEEFLTEVVKASDGIVGNRILQSQEVVTEFTQSAEKKTECLTEVPIDGRITCMEQKLRAGRPGNGTCQMRQYVKKLNERSLELISGLIDFKETILKEVTACQLFTANYPLLIQHIIREAKLYRAMIQELNAKGTISSRNMWNMEKFWNQIMMEHALFIRGLLDPSECELIEAADEFAKEYAALLKEAGQKNCMTMDGLTSKTLKETRKYRDFKSAGTQGITECRITSLILPLLADHVLREANHYLRLLESCGAD